MIGQRWRVLSGGSSAVPAGANGFQQFRAVSNNFLRSLSGCATVPPWTPRKAPPAPWRRRHLSG
eukprot:9013401-Alexandrium_andersonii.AAC.1